MQHKLALTLAVIRTLEKNDVPYMLVNSARPSLYRLLRTTPGPKAVLLSLKPVQTPTLITALEADFALETEMVEQAIAQHSQFRLMHRHSGSVVDVFAAPGNLWMNAHYMRCQRAMMKGFAEAWAGSAEDLLLAKLVWYREDGQDADWQWEPLLDTFRERYNDLNTVSMRRWAECLGVADLLGVAANEAMYESVMA